MEQIKIARRRSETESKKERKADDRRKKETKEK
jgi:hypothetical protein